MVRDAEVPDAEVPDEGPVRASARDLAAAGDLAAPAARDLAGADAVALARSRSHFQSAPVEAVEVVEADVIGS